MVLLGGIIGSELTSNPALATLPLSLLVVAIALTTIPAASLMNKIGRRKSFSLASLVAMSGMLIAVLALVQGSFLLYNLAVMLFGANMAFTHQYRYAAAESVASEYVPRAISLILIGSIGASFLGPELATRGQFWLGGVPYAGTMIALAAMFVLQSILFQFLSPARPEEELVGDNSPRGLGDVVRQPLFIVAVMGAMTGFGLMTLVMTATPLSMHINENYSLQETADVIRIHVLGMYLPSLVTGFLIERLGVVKLMFAGALGLLASATIGLQGHTILHYWWALLLLGVGWNFLYVGGTTMLTYTYRSSERFRTQGLNDFFVFGASATSSLLAGTVMYYFGWTTLMLIPMPFLLMVCIALLVIRNHPTLLSKGKLDVS